MRVSLRWILFLTILFLEGIRPPFSLSYVPDDLDFVTVEEGAGPGPPGPTDRGHMIRSINYRMVHIPPGSFMMGSPSSEKGRSNDELQHKVTLTKGFYIGVTEVTQGQWKAVMGNNPSYFKDCGDDCPVEKVSWYDVQEFIRRLNQKEGTNRYRLPTEAEWEYACRAGSTAEFSFGGNQALLGEYAWYKGNSGSRTNPVAKKKPNAWGLYDMHGNVREWCGGWYEDYPSNSVTDPIGPSSGYHRVLWGGSYEDYRNRCRSANRDLSGSDERDRHWGFRLALPSVQ